jgi:hypothetical protein
MHLPSPDQDRRDQASHQQQRRHAPQRYEQRHSPRCIQNTHIIAVGASHNEYPFTGCMGMTRANQ